MSERERLFFALWPDDELRRRLAKQMRNALRGAGGRPIPPQNLHLTLVFLGALDAGQRSCVAESADALEGRSFTLELLGWEYWRRPRIVSCTMGAAPDALHELVEGLRRIARDCGAQVESRPYVPHLTVMRKAQREPKLALDGPLHWPIREFHLIRSHTYPEGASYELVRSWSLRG